MSSSSTSNEAAESDTPLDSGADLAPVTCFSPRENAPETPATQALPTGATIGDALATAAAPIAAEPAPRICVWEHGVKGDRGYWRCDEPAGPGRPWCTRHVMIHRIGQQRSRLTLRAIYG